MKYNNYINYKERNQNKTKDLTWIVIRKVDVLSGEISHDKYYFAVKREDMKKNNLLKPGRLVSANLKKGRRNLAIVSHVLTDTEKANLDSELKPTRTLIGIYEYDDLKELFSDNVDKIQTKVSYLINKDSNNFNTDELSSYNNVTKRKVTKSDLDGAIDKALGIKNSH